MLLPIMTFNIQHGVDFNRRDKQSLKDFDAMTPEYLEKLKKQPPKAEDPSLIDLDQVAQAIRQCGAEIVALNEVRNTVPGVSDPCFTDQAVKLLKKRGCRTTTLAAPSTWPAKGFMAMPCFLAIRLKALKHSPFPIPL